jgi:VanZ family protein
MCISGIVKRVPSVLGVGGIWYLSSQSVLPRPPAFLAWDKLQHSLAWLVLTLSFALWFSRETWRNRRFFPFCVTVAAASVYGIVDEIHQYFVPGRFSSPLDWFADTLGAIAGAFLFRFAAARSLSGKKHPPEEAPA